MKKIGLMVDTSADMPQKYIDKYDISDEYLEEDMKEYIENFLNYTFELDFIETKKIIGKDWVGLYNYRKGQEWGLDG